MGPTTKTPPEVRKSTALPTPEERPNADVVIYDGHCKFCTAQVQRLARWDRTGRLAFLSLHDAKVRERYPDLSYDALMDEMYVVDSKGGRYHGAGAFRYLTRKLRRLWPLMPIMHLPGTLPIWQAGYRFVARQRYKMGRTDACDGDACSIHFK